MKNTQNVLYSLFTVAMFGACCASVHAQKPPTLADLLLDKGCSIVMDVERDLWRDANLTDYQTSGWKAWMTQTKSATPWRTTGDFDGDGLQDLAKLVIRKADNVWMLGVEFGYKNKKDCRRQQIAWNTERRDARLLGLLAVPKGNAGFVCHHISESQPAICTASEGGLLAARVADAFMAADDIPTRTDGYVWRQFRDIVKSDGTPLMAFESERYIVGMDMAAMRAEMNKDQFKPQVGDVVSPTERRSLITQFDTAFNNADKRSHRITSESVMTHAGQTFASEYTTDFAPPNKFLMTVTDASKAEIVTLVVGSRTWMRKKAADGTVSWDFMNEGAADSREMGAGIGNQAILAVRTETIQGRKVKTIQVGDAAGEIPVQTFFSIDEATKLPVRRLDKMISANSVTTSTYDFGAKLSFPATPLSK